MTPRRLALPTLLAAASLSLAACAGAPDDDAARKASSGYPVKVSNCGFTSTVEQRPTRAVTMNQGATEVALALGVQERLAGTAYLDDEVPSRWKAAYDSVTVLSKEYPDHESLLAAKPDFVYASYTSAFDKDAAGSAQDLQDVGISSYTSPLGCGDDHPRPTVSFDTVWSEVDTVAKVFGVTDRAEKIRRDQKALLADLAKKDVGDGLSVFWYDSGDKTPLAGAGQGGPQLILDAVGATNIFASLKGGWADASWEKVVAADPDVIVLGDASWSSAKDKIAYLEKDPALKSLRAVREKRFVVLPYSETTPGVRLADGAQDVSDGIAALNLG